MPDDPAALIDELDQQFRIACTALQMVGRLAQQLQRTAAETAAASVPRIVRVKSLAAVKPVNKRGRGRPPGAGNHLTLLASPRQIAELRAQLASK